MLKPIEKIDTSFNVEAENKKRDQWVDLGILIIILGLFVLVLTTYLTTSTDISYTLTNNFVLGAVGIQAVGLILIICNIFRKK